MEVEISVSNPAGDREISFGDFQYAHIGCGKIAQRRNPINSDTELRCGCGLLVILEWQGTAEEQIIMSVIDGQPCRLIKGSYHSDLVTDIKVLPESYAK